jgi:hypothetical protein
MGFGFNLGFIFIVLPLTVILLFGWIATRNKFFGIGLGIMWGGVIGIVVLSLTLNAIFGVRELDKEDYYGEYVIDRDYFPGKQADWQYDHYRFEIKRNDVIYFHFTNKEKILKTYIGKFDIASPYGSARPVLSMVQPTHHVVSGNPTVYRDAWSFYLVFNSPKFSNMYFKKESWEAIEQ